VPVYEASTHDDLLSISITLGALSSGRASFSTLLLLVATVTPGGGTLASYANLAEVQADVANLNTIAVAMATAAFGQANPPESILIQGVNTGASQTYVQALDAAIGAGANFYGVLADVRTPATQVSIATDIETKAASEKASQRYQGNGSSPSTAKRPCSVAIIWVEGPCTKVMRSDNPANSTLARELATACESISMDVMRAAGPKALAIMIEE
jgi:hypothetical protein